MSARLSETSLNPPPGRPIPHAHSPLSTRRKPARLLAPSNAYAAMHSTYRARYHGGVFPS
eukprot:1532180-Rhodomonas_salina.2